MDEENKKSFVLFGRDIAKIPCFRNSFLYGILGGFGCGLTCFLFTSRARASTHFGFASYMLITMGYWAQCRYNYSNQKFEMMKIQEMLRQRSLYEGTERDPDLNQNGADGRLVDA